MTQGIIDLTGQFPDWAPPLRRDLARALRSVPRSVATLQRGWQSEALVAGIEGLYGEFEGAVVLTTGVRNGISAIASQRTTVSVETPTFAPLVRLSERIVENVLVTPVVPFDTELHVVVSPCRNPDGYTRSETDLNRLAKATHRQGGRLVQDLIFLPWAPKERGNITRYGGIEIGSLSKLFGPQSSIGWIHSKPEDSLPSIVTAPLCPSAIQQELFAYMLQTPSIRDHLASFVEQSTAARMAFEEELQATQPIRELHGPSLLLNCDIPGEIAADYLVKNHMIGASPGKFFYAEDNSLRASFTNVSVKKAREAGAMLSRFWSGRGLQLAEI